MHMILNKGSNGRTKHICRVAASLHIICLLKLKSKCCHFVLSGCATTVLVTGAGIGEMVLQLLVGSVSA